MGYEVRVIGRKAAQPPSRLSSINLGNLCTGTPR
jgi:hypothetical protein